MIRSGVGGGRCDPGDGGSGSRRVPGGSSAGIEAESIRGVEKRERESMAREREEEEEEEEGGRRRRKEMRRRRRLSLLFSRPDGWRERESTHSTAVTVEFFFYHFFSLVFCWVLTPPMVRCHVYRVLRVRADVAGGGRCGINQGREICVVLGYGMRDVWRWLGWFCFVW